MDGFHIQFNPTNNGQLIHQTSCWVMWGIRLRSPKQLTDENWDCISFGMCQVMAFPPPPLKPLNSFPCHSIKAKFLMVASQAYLTSPGPFLTSLAWCPTTSPLAHSHPATTAFCASDGLAHSLPGHSTYHTFCRGYSFQEHPFRKWQIQCLPQIILEAILSHLL